MNLAERRRQWERGLRPLVELKDGDDRLLVVLETPGSATLISTAQYHCHRYFVIGDNWECSADGQNVTLEAVWSWLNDPSARSTQVIKLPVPLTPSNEEDV